MVRAYLMIVVAIAVAASMLSRAPSAQLEPARETQILDPAGSASSGTTAQQPQTAAMLQDGAIELHRKSNGHF